MANKKCINKRKKLVNKFADGGDTKSNYGQAISGGIDALNTSISLGSIGNQEDIKNRIDNINNTLFKAKDNASLLNEWESFTPMKEVSYTDVGGNSFGDNMKGVLSATASGAAACTAVNPGLGSLIGGGVGLIGGLAGAFVNDYQANKKREELNKEIREANTRAVRSFQNRVNAVDRTNDLALMANYAAEGGYLQHQHGGIFSNGITTINNGGTHEQNPNEGVQIGIDAEGIPNLVEEGEIIWDNYVFSNRLKVPKVYYKKLGITGKKDKTFAEVAKSLQKESEERPNDPISKRGLKDSMLKLTLTQEVLRQQEDMKKQGKKNKMYTGGINTFSKNPYIKNLSDFYEMAKDSELERRTKAINNFPMEDLQKITSLDLINSIEPKEQNFNVKSGTSDIEDPSKKSWMEYLRYAPVLGSALGLAHDLANKPDYSRAKKIEELASKAGEYDPVSFTPIGNYLTYTPLDREYSLNKLNANAGATRRAIANSSSPARDAMLLAADYNAQGKIGDLIRNAEEYNLAQRQAVEQFNRGTNQANAEMRLRTDSLNRELKARAAQQELAGYINAMQLQDNIDAARQASIAANTSNLFTSLGNIGWEAVNRNMVNDSSIAYQIDANGHLNFIPGVSKENINPLDIYNDYIEKGYTEKKAKEEMAKSGIPIKSKGGYLTIKKRR